MRTDTSRLIIMACSARKTPGAEPMPALDRYDGVAYRVLKSYMKARDQRPSVLILSAKHGIIGPLAGIRDYNIKMDRNIAEHMRPENTRRLQGFLKIAKPRRVFVMLGKSYRQAIDLTKLVVLEGCVVTHAQGGIGVMLHQFKEWLNEEDQHADGEATCRRFGGDHAA